MSVTGLALTFLIGLWCIGVVAGHGRVREALRLTLSAPAYLVPAAMAGAGCWWLFESGLGVRHENPFVAARGAWVRFSGGDWVAGPFPNGLNNLLALAIVAAALAGHVGLLQAHRQRQPVNGEAFARGVLDHFFTFLLAKVLLFGALWLIPFSPRGVLAIVFAVPSLLLAPLPGMAARHPRRPLAALAATLRTASDHFNGVGHVAFGQLLFAVGSYYAACRLTHHGVAWSEVAVGSSTLGFGFFTFAGRFPIGVATVAIVLNAVACTMFVTAHFLCAEDDYASETRQARRARKKEREQASLS